MSRKAPIGINDDLPNSTLFKVEAIPRWAKSIFEVLKTTGFVDPKGFTYKALATLALFRPYVLISGRLYKHKSDGILRLCLNLKDYEQVMQNAHISLGGFHVSGKQSAQRILMEGLWWPSLYTDIED